MSLEGKKVAVLMEADYYEPEIWYYAAPLPRGGRRDALPHAALGAGAADVRRPRVEGAVRGRRVASRTWTTTTLRSYAAVIVPSGMVSDRLRYTEDVAKLPPATEFIQRAFARAGDAEGDHLPRHVARRADARARPRPAGRRAQQPARRREEHGRDLHRRGRRRRPRPRHRRAPAATATCSRTRSSSCSSDGRRTADERADPPHRVSPAPTRSRSSGGTRSTSASSASASTCPGPDQVVVIGNGGVAPRALPGEGRSAAAARREATARRTPGGATSRSSSTTSTRSSPRWGTTRRSRSARSTWAASSKECASPGSPTRKETSLSSTRATRTRRAPPPLDR